MTNSVWCDVFLACIHQSTTSERVRVFERNILNVFDLFIYIYIYIYEMGSSLPRLLIKILDQTTLKTDESRKARRQARSRHQYRHTRYLDHP